MRRSVRSSCAAVIAIAVSARASVGAQSAALSANPAVASLTAARETDPSASAAEAPRGWQPLVIPKTDEEKALTARLLGEPDATKRAEMERASALLPPQHSSLRTSVGLGYVTGADWAGVTHWRAPSLRVWWRQAPRAVGP
jgi:hypothetical protein